MTEGVICAIIAGITAVAVGIIDYLSQRKMKMEIKDEMKRNKAERLEHEHNKEQARKEFELCMSEVSWRPTLFPKRQQKLYSVSRTVIVTGI